MNRGLPIELTTPGNKMHGRNDLIPTTSNNVSLGVNVNIMRNITIRNCVVFGAESVVVKDLPDNFVVASFPAKIIRYLGWNGLFPEIKITK